MQRSFPLARRVLAWVLLGVSTLPLASCKRAPTEALTVNDLSLKLPRTVGAWTQSGGPKFVGPEDIFNYMDGGGELYLGYRFKRLEVQRYSSADQGEILVEFYWMETSDDAYGLLSLDWGGESILLTSSTPGSSSPTTDGPRALYGLVCFASGPATCLPVSWPITKPMPPRALFKPWDKPSPRDGLLLRDRS